MIEVQYNIIPTDEPREFPHLVIYPPREGTVYDKIIDFLCMSPSGMGLEFRKQYEPSSLILKTHLRRSECTEISFNREFELLRGIVIRLNQYFEGTDIKLIPLTSPYNFLDPISGFDFNLYSSADPKLLLGRFTTLEVRQIENSDTMVFKLERGLIDLRAVGQLKPGDRYTPLLLEIDVNKERFVIEPDEIVEGQEAGRTKIINRITGVIRGFKPFYDYQRPEQTALDLTPEE